METHLAPVLATQIKSELLGKSEASDYPEDGNGAVHSSKKAHHSLLMEVYLTMSPSRSLESRKPDCEEHADCTQRRSY